MPSYHSGGRPSSVSGGADEGLGAAGGGGGLGPGGGAGGGGLAELQASLVGPDSWDLLFEVRVGGCIAGAWQGSIRFF